jgi:hypothetical protein
LVKLAWGEIKALETETKGGKRTAGEIWNWKVVRELRGTLFWGEKGHHLIRRFRDHPFGEGNVNVVRSSGLRQGSFNSDLLLPIFQIPKDLQDISLDKVKMLSLCLTN